MFAMIGKHASKIDLGQNVAVDNEQGLVRLLEELETTCGPERLLFLKITYVHVERTPVAKVAGDLFR